MSSMEQILWIAHVEEVKDVFRVIIIFVKLEEHAKLSLANPLWVKKHLQT